jgi:hypothetical protein
MNLDSVDIRRPVLKPGPTDFIVAECKVEDTEKGTQKLVVVLKTEFATTTRDGQPINPGFTITTNIGITPTEKYSSERVVQEVTKFQRACGRSGAFGDPSSYINAKLQANVGIEVDAEGRYDDKNVVKFIPRRTA